MVLTYISLGAFWVLSLLVAAMSARFWVLSPEVAGEFVAYHADLRPIAFYAHVGLAPVAMALAPFQFWRGLRMRRPAVHRWIGRGYGVAVLVSGIGGLVMSVTTEAGAVAAWGFGILAVLWLAITARAVILAVQGRIDAHRQWMIRSVALTFGGVTLRLYLPIVFATGLPFDASYSVIAWLAWVPNLIVAEMWLRRGQRSGLPTAIA